MDEATNQKIQELTQLKKDYVETFESEPGKKVLAHLKNLCYTNKTTFPKDSNALTLAFHEGMRYVTVHINNMMNFNLETLHKIVQQNTED